MRKVILRHAAAAAIAFFAVVAPSHAQDAFYTSLLQRGVTSAKQGNWKAAAQQLRLAAFGFLEHIPEYETAHVYAAIASERSAQTDDARVSAEKVVNAERITPSYNALKLDAATRGEFEGLLAKYVAAQRLATVPAFANIRAAGTPAAVVAPALPPLAEGSDIAQRARASWLAGDLANALKLATDAITRDFASGPARQVLGNIAALEQRWSDVVEHFTIARTAQRLTEDEKGKLVTGFVNVGRKADADALRRTLRVAVAPPPPPAPRVMPQPVVVPQPPPPPPPPPVEVKKQIVVARPVPANVPRTPPPTQLNDGVRTVAPTRAPQSPLVAAARHAPSDAIIASDATVMLADADLLLAQGKILAARETFARVAHLQTLNRATLLSAAKGLNQTSAWRESSASYQRAYPLAAGEELHMFHEAVNRYELGDYPLARELLRRALPKLPASREVALYKAKIEAAP